MVGFKKCTNAKDNTASSPVECFYEQDLIEGRESRESKRQLLGINLEVGLTIGEPSKKAPGPPEATPGPPGKAAPSPPASKDANTTPAQATTTQVVTTAPTPESTFSSTSEVESSVTKTSSTTVQSSTTQTTSSSSSVQSTSSLEKSSSSSIQSTSSFIQPTTSTTSSILDSTTSTKSSDTRSSNSSILVPKTSTTSQSSFATITLAATSTSIPGLYNKSYTTSALSASKSSASQGINSKTTSIPLASLIGIIAGLIVFALAIVLVLIFLTRRSIRKEKDILTFGPPSSRFRRTAFMQKDRSYAWGVPQAEFVAPGTGPARSDPFQPLTSHPLVASENLIIEGQVLPTSMIHTTIDKRDNAIPSEAPEFLPVPAPAQLRNSILSDGSVQTVAMPMPAIPQRTVSGRARQILIRANTISHTIPTTNQLTINLLLPEYGEIGNHSESGSEGESESKATTYFYIDTTYPDENAAATTDSPGTAEKRSTFGLLELPRPEHQPAGRWSDPFTAGWRGSGEAEENGTRWKSASSWVESQNGRLDLTLLKEGVHEYV